MSILEEYHIFGTKHTYIRASHKLTEGNKYKELTDATCTFDVSNIPHVNLFAYYSCFASWGCAICRFLESINYLILLFLHIDVLQNRNVQFAEFFRGFIPCTFGCCYCPFIPVYPFIYFWVGGHPSCLAI